MTEAISGRSGQPNTDKHRVKIFAQLIEAEIDTQLSTVYYFDAADFENIRDFSLGDVV
jgi:hypothetical protein